MRGLRGGGSAWRGARLARSGSEPAGEPALCSRCELLLLERLRRRRVKRVGGFWSVAPGFLPELLRLGTGGFSLQVIP